MLWGIKVQGDNQSGSDLTSFDKFDYKDLADTDVEFFKEEIMRHKDQLENENVKTRKQDHQF